MAKTSESISINILDFQLCLWTESVASWKISTHPSVCKNGNCITHV